MPFQNFCVCWGLGGEKKYIVVHRWEAIDLVLLSHSHILLKLAKILVNDKYDSLCKYFSSKALENITDS